MPTENEFLPTSCPRCHRRFYTGADGSRTDHPGEFFEGPDGKVEQYCEGCTPIMRKLQEKKQAAIAAENAALNGSSSSNNGQNSSSSVADRWEQEEAAREAKRAAAEAARRAERERERAKEERELALKQEKCDFIIDVKKALDYINECVESCKCEVCGKKSPEFIQVRRGEHRPIVTTKYLKYDPENYKNSDLFKEWKVESKKYITNSFVGWDYYSGPVVSERFVYFYDKEYFEEKGISEDNVETLLKEFNKDDRPRAEFGLDKSVVENIEEYHWWQYRNSFSAKVFRYHPCVCSEACHKKYLELHSDEEANEIKEKLFNEIRESYPRLHKKYLDRKERQEKLRAEQEAKNKAARERRKLIKKIEKIVGVASICLFILVAGVKVVASKISEAKFMKRIAQASTWKYEEKKYVPYKAQNELGKYLPGCSKTVWNLKTGDDMSYECFVIPDDMIEKGQAYLDFEDSVFNEANPFFKGYVSLDKALEMGQAGLQPFDNELLDKNCPVLIKGGSVNLLLCINDGMYTKGKGKDTTHYYFKRLAGILKFTADTDGNVTEVENLGKNGVLFERSLSDEAYNKSIRSRRQYSKK